jgi:hypothetical protein
MNDAHDLHRDGSVTDAGRRQHEDMPDGVVKGQLVPKQESDAARVEQARRHQKRRARSTEPLDQRLAEHIPGPAEPQIKDNRNACVPPRAEHDQRCTGDGHRPDPRKKAGRSGKEHDKGRVGARDLEVDRRLIQAPQPVRPVRHRIML